MPNPTLVVTAGVTPDVAANGVDVTLTFSQPFVEPGVQASIGVIATGRSLAPLYQYPLDATHYRITLQTAVFAGEVVTVNLNAMNSLNGADGQPVIAFYNQPVFNASTQIDPLAPVIPDPDAELRYALPADMLARFGEKTLIEWTNLNARQTTIDEARLRLSLLDAQDEIDRRLANSRYVVPLTGLNNPDARFMCDLTCKLALVWLYDHRPGTAVDEEGRPKHQGRAMRKEVDRKILNVIAGSYALAVTLRDTNPGVSGFTAT